MRQGCIISPDLFNLYTESVIREAEIEEIGIKVGGNWSLISDTQMIPRLVQIRKRRVKD